MSPGTEGKLWGIVLATDEGVPVRTFLQQLCGGQGIKQFCAVIGRRSPLEHTLTRVEWLIPRERILVVVNRHHREEASGQLAHWPAENIIYQPANRNTLPAILLPLAHVTHRDPLATVTVFPAGHFISEEEKFMATVARATAEVQGFPRELILLGMTPERAEESYGWIEPAAQAEPGRESRAVRRFWEQPSLAKKHDLLARGALWNPFIFAGHAPVLWEMVRQVAPDLSRTFHTLRLMLRSSYAAFFTEHIYETMHSVNFSHGVCEPLISRLRVLPTPDVGWSDWGSVERILTSLRRIGKLDECLARLRHRGGTLPLPETRRRRADLNLR